MGPGMDYFVVYKKKQGGISSGFDPKLAWRESDRDQNLMLVITKSSGFVPHRCYIGCRIEKVGHGCRGGVFEYCGLGRSNGAHSM